MRPARAAAINQEASGALVPEIRYVDATYAIGTVKNVIVVMALGEPHRAFADALCMEFERVAAGAGRGAVLIFVDREHPPPSEGSRLIIQRIFNTMDTRCAGFCLALDGEGFVAAAKRSVTTLAMLTMKGKLRVKIVSTAADAGAWLLGQLGDAAPQGVTPGVIAAVTEQLRRDLRGGRLKVDGSATSTR